jgi:hypothetical protein
VAGVLDRESICTGMCGSTRLKECGGRMGETKQQNRTSVVQRRLGGF